MQLHPLNNNQTDNNQEQDKLNGNFIRLLAGQIVDMITMGDVTKEERQVLEEELEERIIHNLHQVFLDNLDEQGQVVYKRLMNESQSFDSTEFHKFLKEHVPDYEDKVKKAMDNFMTEAYDIVDRRQTELRAQRMAKEKSQNKSG